MRKFLWWFLFLLLFTGMFIIGITSCSKDGANKGEALQTELYGTLHHPLSIPELYRICGLPAPCGQPLVCEGQRACVQGIIDHDNVFDKKHYPQLPYEKFRMTCFEKNTQLEVFVECIDSKAIFSTIHGSKGPEDSRATVCAQVRAVDMPVMGDCRRAIKLVIKDDGQIVIK